MNPSRVAAAHTAQSGWLSNLANEVADTFVQQSHVGTEILSVGPFPAGVEARFESPDYGVTSIFFWRDREDALVVSMRRNHQTSLTLSVDYSRPPATRLVQQIIRWVRDELVDKDVRLGATRARA